MRFNIKNEFLKKISMLASGSIIAQLVTVLIAPILTRLFLPEEIGSYTYILSITSIFMAVINGRYDMSIVIEKNENEVYPLIKLSIIISSILSIIISMIYLVYSMFINNESINYLFMTICIFCILFTYGIINVLTAYNNRNKEYGIMTSVYIIRSVFQNIGAVILGVFNLGLTGLLVPYIIGQLFGIKKQAKSLKKNLSKILKVSKDDMLRVMKLHYKQPLFSAPALFINSFSYSSVVFFIEALFGMTVVGFYSISIRILGLPLAVISGNVSRVFFEEASKEFSKTGQFCDSFKRTTKFLLVLAIPMVFLMNSFVPQLIGIIFGESWIDAGEYIKVLSFMFGIRFVVSSLSTGMIVARKQNIELLLQILFIISSIFCFVISKLLYLDIIEFLKLINITFSISFIVYFIFIYKYSKLNRKID